MAEELGSIKCGGIPMAIGVQSDMATPALTRYVEAAAPCRSRAERAWTLGHRMESGHKQGDILPASRYMPALARL